MAKRDFSPHQQKLIRRYYANLDTIRTQRLGELVTDIYLAASPKRRASLWDRAAKLLLNKDTPAEERAAIEALLAAEDVEALAALAEARFGAGE